MSSGDSLLDVRLANVFPFHTESSGSVVIARRNSRSVYVDAEVASKKCLGRLAASEHH